MAIPSQISSLSGNRSQYALTTTSIQVLAGVPDKLVDLKSMYVANITNVAVNFTMRSTINDATSTIANAIPIQPNTVLVMVDETSPVTLAQGDALHVTVSANDALTARLSWKEYA